MHHFYDRYGDRYSVDDDGYTSLAPPVQVRIGDGRTYVMMAQFLPQFVSDLQHRGPIHVSSPTRY